MDAELLGDSENESYFSKMAEQEVQKISFECAWSAFRSKKYAEANQLCHLVIKMNPNNQDALALLSRLEDMS